MRSILCVLVVCLFATTAAAQFNNDGATGVRNAARTTDATSRKTTDKGHAEHPAKVSAADQAAAETELANALLAVMDRDGDGVVTKAEYAKALAALRKVPKDKQGNMVVPDKAAADPNAAAAAGADPTQAGAGGQAAAGGRGNEAMARFMKYDTNHDGVLSRNEVSPGEWSMAQDAGLVHNGAISAKDWAAFSQKMGDRMRAGALGHGPNNGAGGLGDGGQKQQ